MDLAKPLPHDPRASQIEAQAPAGRPPPSVPDHDTARYERHHVDGLGLPAGGTSTGVGYSITWQDGPISPRNPQNGSQVVDTLRATLGRLRFLQDRYPCPENAITIEHVEAAIRWQDRRTIDRIARGVEGSHQP